MLVLLAFVPFCQLSLAILNISLIDYDVLSTVMLRCVGGFLVDVYSLGRQVEKEVLLNVF